jgi:hypothetical protein
MSETTRPQRRPEVETYVLPDGTALLYDSVTEAGHPLDVLHALIWDYCDGALTRDEIAQEVATLLPSDPTAHDYTLLVLDELAERGLLLAQAKAPDAL